MTTLTEGRHTGEFLVSEASGTRSREIATLKAGNNLGAGTVLGKIASTGADFGKYAVFDEAATNGTETAVAVLYAAVDASSADSAAVIVARDAEVAGNALTWPDEISEGDLAAGIANLAAAGIIVR